MPELDLDSLESAARAERQVRAASREVLPLEYSAKRRDEPPFDWGSTLRQFFFALGVSFATGGIIAWQGSYAAWRDNEVIWISFGAFLITLTIPWPGRIGWKRS
jgi:hypothetical protein